MTNYEYLCKKNKLAIFMSQFYHLNMSQLISTYKIKQAGDISPIEAVCNWLQADCDRVKRYVALDDVIEILSHDPCVKIPYEVKLTEGLDQILQSMQQMYIDKVETIKNLKYAEIEVESNDKL